MLAISDRLKYCVSRSKANFGFHLKIVGRSRKSYTSVERW